MRSLGRIRMEQREASGSTPNTEETIPSGFSEEVPQPSSKSSEGIYTNNALFKRANLLPDNTLKLTPSSHLELPNTDCTLLCTASSNLASSSHPSSRCLEAVCLIAIVSSEPLAHPSAIVHLLKPQRTSKSSRKDIKFTTAVLL